MIERSSLTVVIPCYNEAQAIPAFLPTLREELGYLMRSGSISSFQIIVVDDASQDDSPALLRQEAGLQVIRLDENRGYGFALKTGFAAALGDFVCFMDLDGSYDPKDLGFLLAELRESGADVVQGDRLSRRELGMSPVRRLGNRGYTLLTRLIFRQSVKDVCSGYRVFRRSLAPWLQAIPQNSLNYSLAMTLMGIRNGVEVRELPIRYHSRAGDSKLSVVWDGIRFLLTIAAATTLPGTRTPSPTELG
jgi:glycosyltransferase involved in cell wall biosynthesis